MIVCRQINFTNVLNSGWTLQQHMKYLSVPILLWFIIVLLASGCTGSRSPLALIPENTAIAISAQKLSNLDSLNEVVNLIPPKGRPDQLWEIIERLKLKNLLKDQKTVLVPDRESVMIMIQVQKFLSAGELFEQVESQYGSSIETYIYKGTELYKAGGKAGFFFAMHKGHLLIATQAYPIEAVMDQSGNTGAFKTTEFNRSGKYSVHLNPEMLTTFYSGYLTPAGKDVFRMLGETFDQLQLNIPVNDSLLIQGEAWPKTSDISFETTLTAEQQLRLLEHVPGRVGQLTIKPVSSLIKGKDFEAYVLPWVESHYAVIGKAEETGFEEQIAIFPIGDKVKAEVSITQLIENLSLEQSVDHGMFSIVPIGKTDIWSSSENNAYFVRVDDFVIFAKTMKSLRLMLDDILVGNTMVRNQELLEMISTGGNQFNRLGASASFFNSTLFSDNDLSETFGQLDMSVLVSPLGKGSEQLEFELALQQLSDENRFAGQKIWSTRLPAVASMAPCIVGDKIILQGGNNALYCLNATDGQVIWELRLSDPVIGKIQSISFRNQEALFFNTANELTGIDLSGNYLPGFPWQINEPATAPLTMIDFQNNQDYAFLVPCGQKVFGFEMTGEPLDGWSPLELESPVLFPFQHFQFKQQDYLFTMDSLQQLVVLNKFGESIFEIPALEGQYKSGPYYQNEPGSNIPGINRIVCCNTEGKIKVVNPLGEHFNLRLSCGNNTDVGFAFADVTGDPRKDYLAISGNSISLSGYRELSFETLFEKSLTSELDMVFTIPGGCGNKDLIGTFSKSAGQVFLLKPTGELFPFFPLAGTQPFGAIWANNCKTMTLILANGNEVYAVR